MNLKIKLIRFIACFKTFFWLAKIYYFTKKQGLNELEKIFNNTSNLGIYPKAIRDRMAHYILFNRIVMRSFEKLHVIELQKDELEMGLLIAAFTPVYDDLMDDYGFSHTQLYQLLDSDIYINPGSLEALFVVLYNQIKESHSSFTQFKQYYDRAGVAQDLSITKQKKQETSRVELREIAYEKGGNFCLLFRTAMRHPISRAEEIAIYKIGGLTQYVNDLFDLYEDEKANCFTLPMKFNSVLEMRKDYQNCLEEGYASLFKLPDVGGSVNQCWLILYALLSRGFVALDHYQEIEKMLGQFKVGMIARSKMIVDMEKLSSIFKNFTYVMTWPFR